MSQAIVQQFSVLNPKFNKFTTFGKTTEDISNLNDTVSALLEVFDEDETKSPSNFAHLVKKSPFSKKLYLQLQQNLDLSNPNSNLIQSARSSEIKFEKQFTFGSPFNKDLDDLSQKEIVSPLVSTRSSIGDKNPFTKIQERPLSSIKIGGSQRSSKGPQRLKIAEVKKNSAGQISERKKSKNSKIPKNQRKSVQ